MIRDRWCYKCGDVVTAKGYHYPDGSFNPHSVEVTDRELAVAIQLAITGSNDLRPSVNYWLNRGTETRFREAHYNIALGKHIGTYQP